ncbi:MAG TPA: ABC transporter permease [Candidatus Acidoferrum sp.]|nr:ABC transporter permease [Candidatus Acidoferrum sp.]
MRSTYAIFRKEMGHYFVSPVAYIILAVFLLLSGFFFHVILSDMMQQQMQSQFQGMQMGFPAEFDVPSQTMRNFFGWISFFLLFLTPMLTMGVYAEERKRGTMELLMTSPISEGQIVIGKFLASLTLLIIMLVPTLFYQVFMYFHSEPMPPWRVMFAGYLGAVLLGASLMALGSFISSLTENQLIAAVLTFAAFLVVWVIDIGHSVGGGWGTVFSYLSIIRNYEDFTRGVIDTSSLVYYASFIFLFMFLTVRTVDSMRWRRA